MKRIVITNLLTLAFLVGYSQLIPEKKIDVSQMKSKKMDEAPKKVYIKDFKVFYQMIAEAEKTSYGGRQLGGGSYKGNATARLAVGVEGVEAEDLQEMTNSIYSNYIQKLEGMGLEVLTSKDIPAIDFYEGWELIEGPRVNQEQVEGSLMVIPANFAYYIKGKNRKGKEKTGGFMAGVTRDATGLTTSGLYGPVPKISKELEDAITVEVVLNVPSIYLDPKSNLAGAKVKGGAYLRLESGRVSYISGESPKPGVAAADKGFEVMVKKPIPIDGVFGEQNFKSVATKARTSVPSYASFFTVENTSVELTNTIKCEARDYKTKVGNVLNEYLDISLDKLRVGLNGDKVK